MALHDVGPPDAALGDQCRVPYGYAVALKNGFYPLRGFGWRVGSTGFVRHVDTGGGYAFTVLTDGNSSQVQGMRLVERVSRRVGSTAAVVRHVSGGNASPLHGQRVCSPDLRS